MHEATRRQFLAGQLGLLGLAASSPLATWAAETTPTSKRFLAAVAAGRLEEVRRLLDAEPALLALRDGDGRSAFALALLGRHPEIAELLRARGHLSDLHEAALAGDWERLETLAAAAPERVNQHHPIGGTAMVAAALGGAGRQLWRVYSLGGDPDARPAGAGHRSALRAAFDLPDRGAAEDAAATLLSNGADPGLAEPGGDSALHAAARRGSRELVEMLIRRGARVDRPDADGARPLDLAEEHGHAEVARLLRDHLAIPRDHSTSRRAYDAEGHPYEPPELGDLSPLLIARAVGAAHADLERLRGLLAEDPRLVHAVATTTEGAVEGCAHVGSREIVDYLLERGAPCSLPTAVMRGDARRAGELLREDPLRIHERGAHDFALLWYPVIGGGHLELAERLLAAGAEVERQHWMGTTALHWAAMRGQLEMAELLLAHGADVRRAGRKFSPEGQTPLELAQSRDHREMVALLEARGAAPISYSG